MHLWADSNPQFPHMNRLLPLFLACCILIPTATAQRMKSEKERFTYTQFPSEPLPNGIATFQVNLEQTAYETYGIEFRGWQSEVKAEWKAFKDQWNETVSDITDAKEEDHAQWASVRMDTLILPPAPQPDEYFFDPSEVQHALQLTGFTVGEDGLQVDVVVDPLNITEEKVTVKKVKEKRGEEMVDVNKYIMEVTYVQPTHITVAVNGTTLKTTDANTRPKTWKSQKFDSDRAVREWWAVQKPSTMAQQTKSPVLTAVGSLKAELEDKHCILQKTREAEWHFPKTTGKVNYDDLRAAAFDAQFAAGKVATDRAAAEESMRKATVVWNAALAEADFDDSKARIDRKVAGFLYLNLIQAAILFDDLDRAESQLLEMNKVDAKGGPIKDGERWVEFGRNLATRRAANGL